MDVLFEETATSYDHHIVGVKEENGLQEDSILESDYVEVERHSLVNSAIIEAKDDFKDAQSNKMENMLERLRRFSVDSIKSEMESDTEIEYLNKFTSEVFLGYSSESDYSDLEDPEEQHKGPIHLEQDPSKSIGKTAKRNSVNVERENDLYGSSKELNIEVTQASEDNITKVRPEEIVKSKILECHLCRNKFSHMTFLKKHVLKHDSNFCVSCLICNRTISDPDTLRSHMGLHFEENQFICQSCGKIFRRSSNLLRHEPLCRGEKKPVEQLCTLCGKLCQSKWQLQQHMMFHSDERPFPCSYCVKSFRFKSRLHEHERTHLGIKPHRCTFCKKSFTTSSDLNKHLKRHQKPGFKGYNTENNPNKLSVCKICHKKVVNLKTHMHLHYERGSDTCNICGKMLKSKSLYQHIKIHLEGASYECDVCKRTFNRKDNMMSHRERHMKAGYRPKLRDSQPDGVTQTATDNVSVMFSI